MQALHVGQCGLCNHFGEHHAQAAVLVIPARRQSQRCWMSAAIRNMLLYI
jgi:hypothetical protein